MNKRRALLILGTIVAISAVVVSWYVLSPHQGAPSTFYVPVIATTTSNSLNGTIAEWKTYISTEYGFELKYPNYYNSFQETIRATNQGGIYFEKAAQGGFQVGYKTKITALTSVRAESQHANIGELRINVYDLNPYRISDASGGAEFWFDLDKNQWWQNRVEGIELVKSVSSPPRINVGNNLVGYKIRIGDAGEGFEYILIPMVDKKIIVEVLYYQGIGATQGAPIDTILFTFKIF
jgi:hypothetical protein